MGAVVGGVADIVDEVRGGRCGAVRGEGADRLEPPGRVTELRREEEPGEQEQVLRPLTRPRGVEQRARTRWR